MDQSGDIGELEIGLVVLRKEAPKLDVLVHTPAGQVAADLRWILPGHGSQHFERAPVAVQVSGSCALPPPEITKELVRGHGVLAAGGPELVAATAVGAQEVAA